VTTCGAQGLKVVPSSHFLFTFFSQNTQLKT